MDKKRSNFDFYNFEKESYNKNAKKIDLFFAGLMWGLGVLGLGCFYFLPNSKVGALCFVFALITHFIRIVFLKFNKMSTELPLEDFHLLKKTIHALENKKYQITYYNEKNESFKAVIDLGDFILGASGALYSPEELELIIYNKKTKKVFNLEDYASYNLYKNLDSVFQVIDLDKAKRADDPFKKEFADNLEEDDNIEEFFKVISNQKTSN